jgi:hypothetical protein
MALFPKWLTSDLWSAIKTKDDAIRDFINNELGGGPQTGKLTKTNANDFEFEWKTDQVLWKSFDIGAWNMNANATKQVILNDQFGTSYPIQAFVSVNVIIFGDADGFAYPLFFTNSGNANSEGGISLIEGTGVDQNTVTLNLFRTNGGQFQSSFFDDNARNRGRVIIGYLNPYHV